jgi:hypothetical protein
MKDSMAERIVHAFRAVGCFDHSFFRSQNARIKNSIAIIMEYTGLR